MRRPNLSRTPFQDVRPVWLTGAVLAVAALALTAANLAELLAVSGQESDLRGRVELLRQRHAEMQAANETLNRELAGVRWARLGSEVDSLEKIVAERSIAWGPLLADLERVLPWDVRLTAIAPQSEKEGITIRLSGHAADRDAWLKLLARFFSDEYFADPMPAGERAPGAAGGTGYQFEMKVRYWPGGRP